MRIEVLPEVAKTNGRLGLGFSCSSIARITSVGAGVMRVDFPPPVSVPDQRGVT